MESDRIYETDIVGEGVDDLLTAEEWWQEFVANACCPDAVTAARRLCGCGGSGQVPSGISRLLAPEDEDGEEKHHRLMESREAYGRDRDDYS